MRRHRRGVVIIKGDLIRVVSTRQGQPSVLVTYDLDVLDLPEQIGSGQRQPSGGDNSPEFLVLYVAVKEVLRNMCFYDLDVLDLPEQLSRENPLV